MWLIDYIRLMVLVNDKDLFYDIFASHNGLRKIPNIPDPNMQSTEDEVITSKYYSNIIKALVDKINNNAWDDDLYIDRESKPFSHKNADFEQWIKSDYL